MLEYKIVKKTQFTVMGKVRKMNSDTSYDEIPQFWKEHCESIKDSGDKICGICGH